MRKYFNFPLYIEGAVFAGTVPLSFISTFFYLYASTFFQPDLDVEKFRPGYHTFPFPESIKHFRIWIGRYKQNKKSKYLNIGSIMKDLTKPMRFIWWVMWHPFAMLFTHRGASHWPIIGVWLRIGWLYLWMLFFEGLLKMFHYHPHGFGLIYAWIKAFFPGQKGFLSVGFFLFCFPVYLGDIFHSLVDLLEAIKNGTSFCPPLLRRGIFIKIGKAAIIVPKTIWDHIKDLNS